MKKKIILDALGNEQKQDKPKRKPVAPYVEPESIRQYRRDRDRVLYKLYPELRGELEERYERT